MNAYQAHINLMTLFFVFVCILHIEMTATMTVKLFVLFCYRSFKEDLALYEYNLGHCYL